MMRNPDREMTSAGFVWLVCAQTLTAKPWLQQRQLFFLMAFLSTVMGGLIWSVC